MIERPRPSEVSLRKTSGSLAGRRVVRVDYYVLGTGEQLDHWDFDDWHQPTMGVSFQTEDGTIYSATWDDSLGHYGIDLTEGSMERYLPSLDEPQGPSTVEVTAHRRWAVLTRDPIADVSVIWGEGGDGTVPVAIHMRFPRGDVWIAAAAPTEFPSSGKFHTAVDDVVVVFDTALAADLGLLDIAES
jgi:hypothetical protein